MVEGWWEGKNSREKKIFGFVENERAELLRTWSSVYLEISFPLFSITFHPFNKPQLGLDVAWWEGKNSREKKIFGFVENERAEQRVASRGDQRTFVPGLLCIWKLVFLFFPSRFIPLTSRS
jgi:hypothetical protein